MRISLPEKNDKFLQIAAIYNNVPILGLQVNDTITVPQPSAPLSRSFPASNQCTDRSRLQIIHKKS